MYVRAAKNRDELWLLDHIEALGVDETAFRSRDYVIALDEETNEKAGFGRIRIHKADDADYCELTSLGTLAGWRGEGVAAHVVERLVENAQDEGFEELFAFVESSDYFEELGFREVAEADLPEVMRDRLTEKRKAVSPDAVPLRLRLVDFTIPRHHREAFKRAGGALAESEPEERPEDFGIDPETATYKYDTGR